MRKYRHILVIAVAGVLIVGCSMKEPADYTFAPIYAYATCTAKARAGLDASKVSAEQAAKIVDTCDAELQTAAQAMAYRRAFEGRAVGEQTNLTAPQHFAAERDLMRDLAMCATSTTVSKTLCPRTD